MRSTAISAAALIVGLTAFGDVLVENVQPGGNVSIDSALVSDGGVLFTNSFERGDVRTISDVFPQRTPKTLLANANLSEWRVAGGHIQGLGYVDDDVLPFNVVRRAGEMDVQLQSRGGIFQRCLKVKLVQNGDDIDIVYVYSRFIRTDLSNVGMGVNFDAIPLSPNGMPGLCAADCDLRAGLDNPPANGNGQAFGLANLTLEKVGASGAFQVTASVTPGGTITVADNVAVGLTGEGALGVAGSPTNDNDFAVGGSLSFDKVDVPLTLSGAMTDVVASDETFEGQEWTAELSAVKPTAVISNAKLGQLKDFRNINISGSTTAAVFRVESDGITATMQFQGFFKGNYVACCFVTMTQQGADVHVTMTKAVYIWDRVADVKYSTYFGADFNSITPSDNWKYNISSATMVMERAKVSPQLPAGASGGRLVFGGREKKADIEVPLPDPLRENGQQHGQYMTRTLPNVNLCMLKGFTGVNTSGSTTAAVFFVDHQCDSLTMQVHGFFRNAYTACCYVKMWQSGNDVLVRQTGDEYYTENKSSVEQSAVFGRDFTTVSPKNSWSYGVKYMTSIFAVPYKVAFGALELNRAVTVHGMRLADLRGFSNLNLYNNDITKNGAFLFDNDGQNATVQLQVKFDNFTGCCYIQLRQVGVDIEMKMVKSCYIYDSNAPSGISYYGKDFDLLGDQAESWQYYPRRGYLLFAGEQALTTMSGANTMKAASLVVQTNASVVVTTGGNLPYDGTIEVEAGGLLELDANSTASKGQSIVIHGGGTLAQGPYLNAFSPQSTYLLFDGGELKVSSLGSSYADNSGAYLNFYTFVNGGRVSGGLKPQLLGYSDGYITVSGSKPVEWDCGGLLVGRGSYTLYVNVGDVTGSAASDFVSSGAFREWGPISETNRSQRAYIRKRGAGTWRIDEASPLLSSFVIVEDGVLAFNTDNVMPLAGTGDGGIELAGGTLDLAAGTSNELAGLTLSASSTINIGEGAVLAFGDSSANAWAGGATLDFTGSAGKQSVRFGTNRRGLTPAQRQCIRFNGARMVLDGNGYLVKPKGIEISFR